MSGLDHSDENLASLREARFVLWVDDMPTRMQMRVLKSELEGARASTQVMRGLLHAIAHDARSPLNALVGFTELLHREGDLSESDRDLARDILDASRQLGARFDELGTLLHAESGALTLRPTPLRLRAMPSLAGADVQAQVSDVEVSVDVPCLTRLLRTLVANIGHWAPHDEPLRLRLGPLGPHAFVIELACSRPQESALRERLALEEASVALFAEVLGGTCEALDSGVRCVLPREGVRAPAPPRRTFAPTVSSAPTLLAVHPDAPGRAALATALLGTEVVIAGAGLEVVGSVAQAFTTCAARPIDAVVCSSRVDGVEALVAAVAPRWIVIVDDALDGHVALPHLEPREVAPLAALVSVFFSTWERARL